MCRRAVLEILHLLRLGAVLTFAEYSCFVRLLRQNAGSGFVAVGDADLESVVVESCLESFGAEVVFLFEQVEQLLAISKAFTGFHQHAHWIANGVVEGRDLYSSSIALTLLGLSQGADCTGAVEPETFLEFVTSRLPGSGIVVRNGDLFSRLNLS